MSKKIASEFAIGILVLLAFIVGVVITFQNERLKRSSSEDLVATGNVRVGSPAQRNENVVEKNCTPHYFEGEAQVKAWISDQNVNSDKKGVMVQIAGDDVAKLPVQQETIKKESDDSMAVRLIDPTDDSMKKLNKATREDPASISIHGYAEDCTKPPLISQQQATIAFKKG